MNDIDPDALDERFAIAGHVSFESGPGGLPVARIDNDHAAATIFLQGAQVSAFQPHRQKPVLWLSEHSFLEPGKPIRGGIPICWPWFAAHPDDPNKPFHGLVRTAPWRVLETTAGDAGSTLIRLGTNDDETSRLLWPHAFDLSYTVSVGPELRVELTARNTGKTPFTCTGALHSYFRVGEIGETVIRGLQDREYLDKTDEFKRKRQNNAVTFIAQTDRIYLDTTDDCLIEDRAWQRRIRVAKRGSRTTVVWNPWAEKAALLDDFGDQEYRQMVCVETANAAEDTITVAPGGEHRLTAVIGVGRL